MALTIAEKIQVGDISSYLALNDVANGSLFSPRLDPLIGFMITMETDAIRWENDFTPANTSLTFTSNYLMALCGAYGAKAKEMLNINGGSVVNPVFPGGSGIKSPIKITGADFANATDWDGVNSDSLSVTPSYTLQVFWNDINRFLDETEWVRTQDGVQILIPGFDASTTNLTSVFYIFVSV